MFVGFSKQTGRAYPPRLIPFQFNINQGLALEFGDQYMRVIQNGAFVTEATVAITGASQANPCVITTASTTGAISATANIAAVSSSYAPGELVTLAGGTSTIATVLSITNTKLKSLSGNDAGTGYAPANTITLAGGVQSTPALITVNTTKVVGIPTIAAAGAGGAPGPVVLTGTTGVGTTFQALGTIDGGGALISIESLSVAGSYTTNPTVITAEPVTGGGLVGAQLSVLMGVGSLVLTTPGVFTTNSAAGAFTQASTSGVGTGATFRNGIFAPNAVGVQTAGRYTAYPGNPVSQSSTDGLGAGATFTVTSGAVSPFSTGDWVALQDVLGMTQLNGQIYVVTVLSATTFSLHDVYGANINSTGFSAYVSGGTAARIYTLTTPYNEEDLDYLKFVQSNDVMSLCLVNQLTGVEYAPLDLQRNSNTNWQFNAVVTAATISAPATMTGSASAGGSTNYQYVVTALNPDDGTESVASPVASINSAVNITATAGTITLTWSPVGNVKQYNVYKATPGSGVSIPVGALFGFAGSAYGTQLLDSNIIADFSQVPPKHQEPFARGVIEGAQVAAGGAGYTTVTLTISSVTGSGAILTGVLVGGALSAVIVDNPGHDYVSTDTIAVTGNGAGATATLSVGAQTGTYPSVPAYFQQRRVYANTSNRPNTYFMSQPAGYTNFDSRLPTIDTDAIIGNPWAVQLNGIQFMVQQPGGLVVFTGKQAWQLTGNGGSSFNPQPITPSSQDAQPQAFNGCSATIPPVIIDNESLYYDPFNGKVYDFSYQYAQNVYTGADLTLNSSHLFANHTAVQTAWCREPFKTMWQVRNDGLMLSLTYLKPQEIAGWGRHDTNGLFKSVCSVTEPPVDALYVATQRFPGDHTAYMIERMDNRLWSTVEDAWCVDCGVRLPQPAPAAVLTASSATGLGEISGFTGLVGGENYSAGTTARIVDDNGAGPGTGAIISLTISSGVITAVNVAAGGTAYAYPALVIEDPENSGSGAAATATLNNAVTFTADAAVFGSAAAGDVIRMGGGIAAITSASSPTVVQAQMAAPITVLIPNSGGRPAPATSGNWTMTRPTTSVSGLRYLAGATVTGTYDGHVLEPAVVPANGTITLPAAASAVTLGLGFMAQVQTTNLNLQGAVTVQGQRKAIESATVRVEASRGIKVGTNQPDGAALSPAQIAPEWHNMTDLPDLGRAPYGSTVKPLYTGDVFDAVTGGFGDTGQLALQQGLPLPMNILACIPVVLSGDLPETEDPRPQRGS